MTDQIQGVVKSKKATYRWGWEQFRIGWIEGAPSFTLAAVGKEAAIHIPVEDIVILCKVLEDLARYTQSPQGTVDR